MILNFGWLSLVQIMVGYDLIMIFMLKEELGLFMIWYCEDPTCASVYVEPMSG